ncbi:MAG: hypothetical protein K2L56_09645, partial [Prevotella sp.]|nr:hypothetical protein [Prevotella sp.]
MSQRPTNKQATPVKKTQATQNRTSKTQGKPQTVQSKPGTAQNKSRQTAKPAAKYDDNRVYLLHSDNLHYDKYRNPDAQILDGNVAFRHQGATLYCDSAHFYEKSNSFEAFNNVKMYQGDTLSLFSDYAFY